MAIGWHHRRYAWRSPERFWDGPTAQMLQWVVCLAILAVMGYRFHAYLRVSPAFAVQWVSVEGAAAVAPAAVLAASGITKEDNLLFLDRWAVRGSVEAMPYIKTCALERVFPNQVVLSVLERDPVATLLVNNHLFELDREGVVLRQVAADAAHPGPLITNVPDLVSVEPGQRLDRPPVSTALAAWDAFERVPMAAEVAVSELAALDENEIVMVCDDLPYEIRWGRGDFSRQARLLNVLWEDMGQAIGCQEYLDLRFGDDLVCK